MPDKNISFGIFFNHLCDNVMGLLEDEIVGVIFDKEFKKIMMPLMIHFRKNHIKYDRIPIDSDYTYESIPNDARRCILSEDNHVVIFGVKNNLWHTDERKSAKYELGKRMVNFIHPSSKLTPSFLTPPAALNENGRQLYEKIKRSRNWHVSTPTGTDINGKFAKEDKTRFFENGDYSSKKSGGDFPSGEVGFGPEEGSVEGIIVFDYKVQHIGFCSEPIKIRVEQDRINVISNNNASKTYQKFISKDQILSYISEVSLGINPDWSESPNPLSIVEEKNLGTVHFGHGGNKSYGNRIGPHFDAVIRYPTLELDGKTFNIRKEYKQVMRNNDY